jgi:hypothetical protein
MCNVLLPPGANPIAVNKYISYINNIQVENFSKTRGHVTTLVQGHIIHARNLNRVYMYTRKCANL